MIQINNTNAGNLEQKRVFHSKTNRNDVARSVSANQLMDDMEFIRILARNQRMLTHPEQFQVAREIYRLRVAFQRFCIQERPVVDHLLARLSELFETKKRIDGVCEVAMNNVELRKTLRAKMKANLPTIRKLIEDWPQEANAKSRFTTKLIRLLEELRIRNRHYVESPFANPKAQWILELYDERCRELVLGNLRLAISVAAKVCHKSQAALPDMVQEGIRGLMHAATKFDYRRGIRFSTYATPWIKQAILATIPNHFRNIRIPLYFDHTMRKVKREHESRNPLQVAECSTIEHQIAHDASIERELAQRILTADRGTRSLDVELEGSGDGRLRSAILADPNAVSPITHAQNSELSERVQACFSVLNSQELMVITLHYGIGNIRPMSLVEIGREKGLSRERIRQVLRRATDLLKPELEEAKLTPGFV